MHNATIAIIVFFSFSILEPEAWAEKKKDLYKTLLIVTSESKVDRKKREKRLRYIIPRMAKLCKDCKDGWDVGDKIVHLWKKMDEAGLEEDIYATFNNLFRVTTMVSAAYKMAQPLETIDCSGTWPIYALLRIQGTPAEKTVSDIGDIALGIARAADSQKHQ